MGEVFVEAFSSGFVGVPDDPALSQIFAGSLGHCAITVDDVFQELCNLDDSTALKPDCIHPKHLKECAAELAYPLYEILNRSLEESSLPAA